MVEVNTKVSNFSFVATSDIKGKLSDFKGKRLVIYFYPKDATPGCTTESQNFRDHYQTIKQLNTEVIGLSRDSLSSHERFKEKQALPFELISDEDEKICDLFDVIKEKNMYGRKYMGIERSTFIIDEKGKLIFEKRKVKVKGHVEEVIQFLQNL